MQAKIVPVLGEVEEECVEGWLTFMQEDTLVSEVVAKVPLVLNGSVARNVLALEEAKFAVAMKLIDILCAKIQ